MRAWKNTTTVDLDAQTEHIKNHMLDREGTREFTSTVPGTLFCGDITYLREYWLPGEPGVVRVKATAPNHESCRSEPQLAWLRAT